MMILMSEISMKKIFDQKIDFLFFCLEIIVDVFEMHYDTIEDSLDI